MAQLRGVMARKRKWTDARASPSRSCLSCRYWATRTGWQKCTSDSINSREVSRGSTELELAALDAVAQDRFEDHTHVLFVGAYSVPAELDRGQHHIVNSLVRQMIFPVIGEDFNDQPLDALGRRARRAHHHPGPLLELA